MKKVLKSILFIIIGILACFWLIVGEIILGVGLKTAAVINWYIIAALFVYVLFIRPRLKERDKEQEIENNKE